MQSLVPSTLSNCIAKTRMQMRDWAFTPGANDPFDEAKKYRKLVRKMIEAVIANSDISHDTTKFGLLENVVTHVPAGRTAGFTP